MQEDDYGNFSRNRRSSLRLYRRGKASEAISEYQVLYSLDDTALVTIWRDKGAPRQRQIEKLIIDAVDANGSAKRAEQTVPSDINLIIE